MSIKKVQISKGIRWEVRLLDTRGRSYYKRFEKKVQAEEYEKIEKLKRVEGYVSSTDNRRKKYTVRELCDEFTRRRFPRLRQGTIISYRHYIASYIIPIMGEKRVSNISKKELTVFENDLLGRGFSIQTIHNIVFFFSTLMNYAYEELAWIDRNLTKNYKPKKLEKSSVPIYWEYDDIEQYFSNSEVKENYYNNLYLFLLNTGCRIGEACGLRVGDVDFSRKRAYIGWTIAKNDRHSEKFKGIGFSLNRQKGSNDRFVPINDTVLSLLKKQCENKSASDFVFTNKPDLKRSIVLRDGNNKDEVIEASVVNSSHFSHYRFKPLQKSVGIAERKHIGAHGLRHTFASHFMMNGGDLYTLSKIMGHSSIKITEIYAHLSPKYLMDVGSFVNFKF